MSVYPNPLLFPFPLTFCVFPRTLCVLPLPFIFFVSPHTLCDLPSPLHFAFFPYIVRPSPPLTFCDFPLPLQCASFYSSLYWSSFPFLLHCASFHSPISMYQTHSNMKTYVSNIFETDIGYKIHNF